MNAPFGTSHLRLVPSPHRQGVPASVDRTRGGDDDARGDLVLLGALLAVGAFPLVGEAFGLGFGQGTLGASAALSLLSGRELLSQTRELLRARP
ncbi:MAG: hypothetical protein QM704_25740 [Anaeromyxobacteraceae bacterium]